MILEGGTCQGGEEREKSRVYIVYKGPLHHHSSALDYNIIYSGGMIKSNDV
jgi:hypothetical protein